MHSYLYKVKKNGKTIDKHLSHSERVFGYKIRTINWKDLAKNSGLVYLKINYGKKLDNFGKLTSFWNDGEYEDRDSFYLALNAFLEE